MTAVNNTLLELINKIQHMSEMIYFYKPPSPPPPPPTTPHTPSARRTCDMYTIKNSSYRSSYTWQCNYLVELQTREGSCVRRSHHTPGPLKLASHWITLPIILHQTDVSCSHCGWLGHSKSTLVVSEGYCSFI